jgi:hypothetical protein
MTAGNDPSKPVVPGTPGKIPAPRYSVNQYEKHAASIKQINEWLLDDYRNQLSSIQHQLRDKDVLLEGKGKELAEKDTQLRLSKQELGQLKDASIIQFVLSILSVVLSSYGVNLITATPPIEVGWVMVGTAIIIQVVSFIMTYQARMRKTN